MENSIKILKERLKLDIFDKLSNIEFIYKGFHNYTFKANYKNVTCQIRIPISKLVNHQIEEQIVNQFQSTLYYENGILIRKWFDGKTLDNVKLTKQIQLNVLKKIKEFHQMQINVPNIDLFYYEMGSKKYQNLVNKYSNNTDFVTSHLDLSPKNILIDKDNNIELIDFEWVRKAHPFIDPITLFLTYNFDKKIIKKEFSISEKQFNEVLYICEKFREYGYKKIYANILKNNNLQQINTGYTNLSYKYNDLFIQKKRKNIFNHLNKTKLFNKLKCNEKTIFENKNLIIKKFIKSQSIDFNKINIQNKIINSIVELQKSKIKLSKNNIAKRIEFYIEKISKNTKFQSFFTEKIQKLIIENAKKIPNEVPSHNDLNRENILLNTNLQIKFIDFEYSSMNSKYFDLAYHCSDLDYDKKEEKRILEYFAKKMNIAIDWNEYFRVKAIVNFYGIVWSLNINPNFNFDWLAKHVFNNLQYLK